MTRKLTVADIADLRAYEREREAFRDHVIALKKKRRIAIGPIVTCTFENRDTIRFQIQEMARAEKIITDEGIAHEVETYNALIPDLGHLSATLFIELTTKEQLMEWLPKLVGIERSVELVIEPTGGGDPIVVRSIPEESHEEQLTRPDITASVHYIGFGLSGEQVDAFARAAAVRLGVNHDHYIESTVLGAGTREELLSDLRG